MSGVDNSPERHCFLCSPTLWWGCCFGGFGPVSPALASSSDGSWPANGHPLQGVTGPAPAGLQWLFHSGPVGGYVEVKGSVLLWLNRVTPCCFCCWSGHDGRILLEPALLPEHADYYPAGRDINPFAFTDQDGQPFVPASLTGHWTFLFVGYTFCPDICPTTLADLRSVYPELKRSPRTARWCSSRRIRSGTTWPVSRPIPLSSTRSSRRRPAHDKLFPFVRNLGLIYSIADQGEKDYLIDHSASIVLINPVGKLEAVFRPV